MNDSTYAGGPLYKVSATGSIQAIGIEDGFLGSEYAALRSIVCLKSNVIATEEDGILKLSIPASLNEE